MIPPGALSTPGQQRVGGALIAIVTALMGAFLLFAFLAELSDENGKGAAPALFFGLAMLSVSVGFGRMSATAYDDHGLGVGMKGVMPYMFAMIFVGMGLLVASKGS